MSPNNDIFAVFKSNLKESFFDPTVSGLLERELRSGVPMFSRLERSLKSQQYIGEIYLQGSTVSQNGAH